jgi:hypothetical protein
VSVRNITCENWPWHNRAVELHLPVMCVEIQLKTFECYAGPWSCRKRHSTTEQFPFHRADRVEDAVAFIKQYWIWILEQLKSNMITWSECKLSRLFLLENTSWEAPTVEYVFLSPSASFIMRLNSASSLTPTNSKTWKSKSTADNSQKPKWIGEKTQ